MNVLFQFIVCSVILFFSLSVWVTYTDDYDPKIERVNREVFLMIVI